MSEHPYFFLRKWGIPRFRPDLKSLFAPEIPLPESPKPDFGAENGLPIRTGAVFGVLLAFGMMHPNAILMLLFPPIPIKAKYLVIGYGVLELFLGTTGLQSGVAHFAHLGGMLWGFFLLRYWKKKGEIYY